MDWADDDEFPPLGTEPIKYPKEPSQPNVTRQTAEISTEKPKPKLDRSHGFLRVIERNQVSFFEYGNTRIYS